MRLTGAGKEWKSAVDGLPGGDLLGHRFPSQVPTVGENNLVQTTPLGKKTNPCIGRKSCTCCLRYCTISFFVAMPD